MSSVGQRCVEVLQGRRREDWERRWSGEKGWRRDGGGIEEGSGRVGAEGDPLFLVCDDID